MPSFTPVSGPDIIRLSSRDVDNDHKYGDLVDYIKTKPSQSSGQSAFSYLYH